MRSEVFKELQSKLNRGEYAELAVSIEGREFIRGFIPDDRLILLGGGHVSLALARIAVMLGFSITVVDDRPSFANSQRFDMADMVISDSFENAIAAIGIRENDYVCVLTRGHQWDSVCVRAILAGDIMPYYLGMIGSRRRSDGMRQNLADEGYPPERIAALNAPIGLSIGGVTPQEIAVSICAQLIQKRHEKPGEHSENTMAQMNTDMAVINYLAESEEPRALLIVLDSKGSTPVKSGSMMAVNSMMKGYGTIGGGCSENEAVMAARRLIGTGRSKIIEVDMTDEVAAENGMVCGGCMRILIEDIT